MKARYKHLLENSIAAILSAIEIYNKPDFKYRNEIFVILTVNAWELILKSKILKDKNGNLNELYIKDDQGKVIFNRNKTPKTIDIFTAININKLETNLKRNLDEFVKIRDNAIHFYNKDKLNYLIFTLGVANLKNYQKLVKSWYKQDLLEYNFYILPLGFAYSFKGYSQLDLQKEPELIKSLIETIKYYQDNPIQGDYEFICEIEVKLNSAKKITENTDVEIGINKQVNGNENTLFYETKKLTDKYPLTYAGMWLDLKKAVPNAQKQHLNEIIKKFNIKTNEKYSAYNFRSKEKEENFKKTGKMSKDTPVIYNHDCLRFIIGELQNREINDSK